MYKLLNIEINEKKDGFYIYFENILGDKKQCFTEIKLVDELNQKSNDLMRVVLGHLNNIFQDNMVSLNQYRIDDYVKSYCKDVLSKKEFKDVKNYDMVKKTFELIDEFYDGEYILLGYKIFDKKQLYLMLKKSADIIGKDKLNYDLIVTILNKQGLYTFEEKTISFVNDFVREYKDGK